MTPHGLSSLKWVCGKNEHHGNMSLTIDVFTTFVTESIPEVLLTANSQSSCIAIRQISLMASKATTTLGALVQIPVQILLQSVYSYLNAAQIVLSTKCKNSYLILSSHSPTIKL